MLKKYKFPHGVAYDIVTTDESICPSSHLTQCIERARRRFGSTAVQVIYSDELPHLCLRNKYVLIVVKRMHGRQFHVRCDLYKRSYPSKNVVDMEGEEFLAELTKAYTQYLGTARAEINKTLSTMIAFAEKRGITQLKLRRLL